MVGEPARFEQEDSVSGVLGALAKPLGSRGLKLFTDGELEALPSPEYLVDRHIEAGAFTVVYGPAGSGKTFTVLDYALCVATGTPWHGHAVKQASVVYIVGEGTSGIKKRVFGWKQHKVIPTIERVRFTTRAVQLLDRNDVQLLLDVLQAQNMKPGLIVFDTLATCFVGGDENSAQDMGRAVEQVRYIQQHTGAAVIVVHHTGKPKDGGGTTERGSSALRGAADAMVKVTSSKRVITIANDKRKDDEETPKVKAFLKKVYIGEGPDGREVTSCVLVVGDPDESQDALPPREQAALDALAAAGGEAPTSVWLDKFKASEATLHRRRRALVDLRLVEEVGNIYRLTAAGRQAVTTVSCPATDTTVPSVSHPEGVTLTADMTDIEEVEEAA